jgi:hypothetical protein
MLARRSARAIAPVATVALAALGAAGRPQTAGAQAVPSCTSSIRVLFNQFGQTRIPAGSTIWFSSVLEGIQSDAGKPITKPLRIDVRQSRITFGLWPYVINMPDSTIAIDPAAGAPQRWWIDDTSWSVTYAPPQIPEAFFDGMPYKAPEAFIPGYSGPVTWTATFTASRPGATVRWAWSAAAYSQFGANGRLLVKPLSVPVAEFQNTDSAGTPELFKQYVVAGAMGGGSPNYPGTRSESASVVACQASKTPPPTTVRPPQPVRQPARVFLISNPFGAPSFASPVSQEITFADGSIGKAVSRCYATDLCALISYGNNDRLAIYSEGAGYCRPYVLHFERKSLGRTIYSFSRVLDYDEPSAPNGRHCVRTRTTHVVMDGGRERLTISKNADGTLRFRFGDL